MTRNAAQAEDVVQDVFLKMLRSAGGYRGDGSFRAWMFNIARNATLDHLRRNRRHDGAALDPESDELLVDHRSAEQSAADRERMGVLSRALASLPTHVREVIWLARFEFNTFEELARALDCKTGTARVRMHRAMQQLHLAFTELNGAPYDG